MPRAPRRVVWAPRAKQDLRSIWRYFARVASPDIADNLLRDINRAAAGLDEGALQWRARDDVMPGCVRCVRIPTPCSIGDRCECRNRACVARAPEFSRSLFERKAMTTRFGSHGKKGRHAAPMLLGGPRFQMMGPLVTNQFQQNNWPFGGAIAFILMTGTLVLTLAANWVVQGRYRRGGARRPYQQVTRDLHDCEVSRQCGETGIFAVAALALIAFVISTASVALPVLA
jgi:plasmid stabilization system protein ParE